MSRWLKKIEFILENCEVITFNEDDFLDLYIENVSKSIHRSACNAINEFDSADMFFYIFKRADKPMGELGFEKITTTKFKRLLHNDITSVELHYKDGSSHQIFTHWEDADTHGESNKYMKSKLTNRGDLKIYIAKHNEKLYNLYFQDDEDPTLVAHFEDFYKNSELTESEHKRSLDDILEDIENEPEKVKEYLKEAQDLIKDEIKANAKKTNIDFETGEITCEIDDEPEQTYSLCDLTKKEYEAIKKFKKDHYEKCGKPIIDKARSEGLSPATGFSAGSRYIYNITGTSIGDCVEIECPICHEKLDVTDQDKF